MRGGVCLLTVVLLLHDKERVGLFAVEVADHPAADDRMRPAVLGQLL